MIRPVTLFDAVDAAGSDRCPFQIGDQPYTGLAVELNRDGSIAEVHEVADGFPNGFVVEFTRAGALVYAEAKAWDLSHGLFAEWDDAGNLRAAEKRVCGYVTERLTLTRGKDAGQTEIIDAKDDIAAIRRDLRVDMPDVSAPLRDLLVAFDGKGEALYREAQLGLGRG